MSTVYGGKDKWDGTVPLPDDGRKIGAFMDIPGSMDPINPSVMTALDRTVFLANRSAVHYYRTWTMYCRDKKTITIAPHQDIQGMITGTPFAGVDVDVSGMTIINAYYMYVNPLTGAAKINTTPPDPTRQFLPGEPASLYVGSFVVDNILNRVTRKYEPGVVPFMYSNKTYQRLAPAQYVDATGGKKGTYNMVLIAPAIAIGLKVRIAVQNSSGTAAEVQIGQPDFQYEFHLNSTYFVVYWDVLPMTMQAGITPHLVYTDQDRVGVQYQIVEYTEA